MHRLGPDLLSLSALTAFMIPRPQRINTRRWLLFAGIALVAFTVWKLYPSANNHLAARDIPRLPLAAKVEQLREGGFFAGFLYVRASLSPEDFEAYAAKFSRPRETLGRGKNQVLVVRSGDFNALLEKNYPVAEIQFQEKLAGTESWWTTHEITNGFVYRWSNGVDGWRVYFDADRHLVFIYWHHS